MITDLVQIKRLGEKAREENSRFRVHMKTHGYNERRLRKIGEEIEEQIDCTVCANCCKVATVALAERDADRIAKALRISRREFIRDYTVENLDENTVDLKRTEEGCVFLSGHDCLIYEDRPDICRYFPHIVKGQGPLSTRMWQFIDRASYCPIVYNSLEAFKESEGFPEK